MSEENKKPNAIQTFIDEVKAGYEKQDKKLKEYGDDKGIISGFLIGAVEGVANPVRAIASIFK